MFTTRSSSSPLSVQLRGFVHPLACSDFSLISASLLTTEKSESPLSALVGPSPSSYLTNALYWSL